MTVEVGRTKRSAVPATVSEPLSVVGTIAGGAQRLIRPTTASNHSPWIGPTVRVISVLTCRQSGSNEYRTSLHPHYTIEDYRRWEGEWELIDGVAISMTPTVWAA